MQRTDAMLDIENLVDFFQVKIREHDGTIHNFATWGGGPPLDLTGLATVLARTTIYTFNGINYDLPILTLALYGAIHEQLKECGDNIITRGMKWWQIYKHYGIQVPDYINHVDLMDVAPGVSIGLKMYMGRMHCKKMQSLPVAYDKPLPAGLRIAVSTYCNNDLEGNLELYTQCSERLALRAAMSAQYGVDLRSKSDAQIAEAVIKSKLNFDPQRRYVPHGFTFAYEPPPYIRFVTPDLQELLRVICSSEFVVTDKEEAYALGVEESVRTGVVIPDTLRGRDIRIANGVYRMGIGGLHSQESSVSYYSDDTCTIEDVDVKSYYPSMILAMGMNPEQLGEGFTTIYREIYTRRLQAKSEAERLYDLGLLSDAREAQTESDGLKIVLNGTFGKLFSKYSILYAPELGIRTTLSGQLLLLMLIEMMELSGINVLSANTDGIVLRIPKDREWIAHSNVAWWESATGLAMEYTRYRSIHMRDVNNYIAITTEGKVKRKGIFAQGGLLSGPGGKHPDKDICGDAVVAYLKDGVPLADTVRGCSDIRKFVQIRRVKGGAIYTPTGEMLGDAIRWYYSKQEGHIIDAKSHNKVAGSDYAFPCMELPDEMPANVDFQHYIDTSQKMIDTICKPR